MDGRKEGNVLFDNALNTFCLVIWKEGNVLFDDALNTFYLRLYGRKEGNVLFDDALNTFLFMVIYGIRYMVKDHLDSERRNLQPPQGYSFRLAARFLLYASTHIQDNTYHSLHYTSRGALARTRNS